MKSPYAALVVCCALLLVGCGGRTELPVIRRPSDEEEETSPPPPQDEKPPQKESSSSNESEKPAPKPKAQLSSQQQQKARRMARIGTALLAYAQDKGHFPPFAVHSNEERMLSWMVAVLPYLGEHGLYRQFDLKRRWNSSPNEELLAEMPEVFRVPGYDEVTTTYMLVAGPGTCFSSEDPTRLDDIKDGLDKTLILVDADGYSEKKWTAYGEFSASRLAQLLKSSPHGVLGLWADGKVGLIPKSMDPRDMKAAVTIDGGETSDLWQHVKPVSDPADPGSVAEALASAAAPAEKTSGGGNPSPANDGRGSASDANAQRPPPRKVGSTSGSPSSGGKPASGKPPIPSERAQAEAMRLVKELFLERYQDADNSGEKKKIAREMLAKSTQLGDDVAGTYVMLTTAQRIAMESNDVETAGKALDALLDRFDLDAYQMKIALLRKTESLTQKSSFDTEVMDQAKALMRQAVKRDDYEVAEEMADVALAAARRINDRDEVIRLGNAKRDLDKKAAAFAEVQASLEQVGDPSEDSNIAELAGRYYCLMKGDWEKGLPMLARGADADLARLSQRDLESPTDPERQLALADGWWEASKKARPPEDDFLRERALHWYETALNGLPRGLTRLKAELRAKTLKQEMKR